jgi:hypothetical protein
MVHNKGRQWGWLPAESQLFLIEQKKKKIKLVEKKKII